MNGNHVVDTLVLLLDSRRDQLFHADKTLAHLVWIILQIPIHLERLEYEELLLAGQPLVSELIQEFTEVIERHLVLQIDDFTREQLPFFRLQLLRYRIEKVY